MNIKIKRNQIRSFYKIIICFLVSAVVSHLALAGTPDSDTVADNPKNVCPISVGEPIPEAILKDVNSKPVTLSKVLAEKPTLLIFYRGSWCPYCSTHLGELKAIESELTGLGYQIIAVSPDLPKNLKSSIDKNQLTYTLLSDSNADLIKSVGLAFRVDNETIEKYHQYNIDLELASGNKHHILPVPAALLVGVDGIVKFIFYAPDYKVRVKKEVLLAAAKSEIKK